MRHRRRTRMPQYDYSWPGAYFFTVCTHRGEPILGEIAAVGVILSPLGELVRACWNEVPVHFPHASLDEFVVMPNHIHGIVVISGDHVGARHASPLRLSTRPGRSRGSLSAIVGSLKSASSRRINALRGTPGESVWQRGFYDHVIRNDDDLARVREYVATNPLRWFLEGKEGFDHARDGETLRP